MKKLSILTSTRTILLLCNFFLMSCGILLIVFGFLLLCDWPKVLLSRLVLPIIGTQHLPQPPLYYAALLLLGSGLIICSAAILGCWSACVFNYCILTITFLIVIALLFTECIIYGAMLLWPGCIGLSVSPPFLTRNLQRNYGKLGFEQYTAAVDYAQTNLKCCGISSSAEYDLSVWKIQGLSHQNLQVPLTCCILSNIYSPAAYTNPNPVDRHKCQRQDSQQNVGYRHQQGCISKLEDWYKHQFKIFLTIGFILMIVEFATLLCILLACTRVNLDFERNALNKITCKKVGVDNEESFRKKVENIYENENEVPPNRFRNNDSYTISRSFRHGGGGSRGNLYKP